MGTPAYVAVAGKARMYSPEPGASYTSIRPEEINVVDRSVRDRWVCHTADLTLKRIAVTEKALASGFRGEELTWHLITATEDAPGVSRAIDHYQLSYSGLQAYKQMVINALSTIVEAAAPEAGEVDLEKVVTAAVTRLDGGEGARYDAVLEELQKDGYDPAAVESAISALMSEGRCYEPKIGVLKLI